MPNSFLSQSHLTFFIRIGNVYHFHLIDDEIGAQRNYLTGVGSHIQNMNRYWNLMLSDLSIHPVLNTHCLWELVPGIIFFWREVTSTLFHAIRQLCLLRNKKNAVCWRFVSMRGWISLELRCASSRQSLHSPGIWIVCGTCPKSEHHTLTCCTPALCWVSPSMALFFLR